MLPAGTTPPRSQGFRNGRNVRYFGSWNWLIFGVLLMALKLLAPGALMFLPGLSAFLVGVPSSSSRRHGRCRSCCSDCSPSPSRLWRRIARRKPGANPDPFLNKRSDALVGRICTLDRPIIDGEGIVRIDDTVGASAGRIRLRGRG